MTTTAQKQIKIAKTSARMILSPNAKNAMIETQNGLVYQHTMIKESGARGAAIINMIKLI